MSTLSKVCSIIAISAGLAIIAGLAANDARADCHYKSVGYPGSGDQLAAELAPKLKPLGVSSISKRQNVPSSAIYRLNGSSVYLTVNVTKDAVTSVNIGAFDTDSMPVFEATGAHVLSRLSGVAETDVRTKLSASLAAHAKDESWNEDLATTRVLISRPGGAGLAISPLRTDCL